MFPTYREPPPVPVTPVKKLKTTSRAVAGAVHQQPVLDTDELIAELEAIPDSSDTTSVPETTGLEDNAKALSIDEESQAGVLKEVPAQKTIPAGK